MQNIDINNIVRSVAIAAVGIPLSLSLSGLLNTASTVAGRVDEPSTKQTVLTEYEDQLVKACVRYAFSDPDSKLERESKSAIDEVIGGEVSNYGAVCSALVW